MIQVFPIYDQVVITVTAVSATTIVILNGEEVDV